MALIHVPLPEGVDIRLREPVRNYYLWTARHPSSAKPIGTLESYVFADHRYYLLSDFQVLPNWQNQHIGTTMLANALQLLHGLRHVVRLEVLRDNTDAQRLYERMGGLQDDTDSRDYFTYWFRPPPPPLTAPSS